VSVIINLVILSGAISGYAADFPPLSVEISADHPLFIFQNLGTPGASPELYAQQVAEVWGQLPNSLKPYSVLQLDAPEQAPRMEFYEVLFRALQGAGVPLVARISSNDFLKRCSGTETEALLRAYTTIKGVEVAGVPFNVYDPLYADEKGVPYAARWLTDIVDAAARYGRFVYIPLGEVQWARMMARPDCTALRAKMIECKDYVIPACLYRDAHTVANQSALMGMWLEDMVSQWGLAADARWYLDAGFVEPGIFGKSTDAAKIPSGIYRAMVLNGAMTGAAVYSFAPETSLWFGMNRTIWDTVIFPVLSDLTKKGLIARKDFVTKKARVACQLVPAGTPMAFHTNLRDIDGVLDQGLLIHGAYGMERPGQVPELVLNRGDHYWVPLISPEASAQCLDTFAAVVTAGSKISAQEWTTLLDQYRQADGSGAAFLSVIGRGAFIMNTRENIREPQSFALPAAPAPVRKVLARREGDAVELTWPFREGNVSYTVYKRVLPEMRFTPIVEGLLERRYVDTSIGTDQSVGYAVTALTNDLEPYEGTVNYGEYLALSMVESRIAEEALINPLLSTAESTPIAPPEESAAPAPLVPSWPNLEGLDETQQVVAKAIAERIESWDNAVAEKDLNGVLGVYANEYEDPQGWHLEYVKRAYQSLFEVCAAPKMLRQIRNWDFSEYASAGTVKVTLYGAVTGFAVSDASGRKADIPIRLPRTDSSEILITFTHPDNIWRIVRTDPAFPNLRDLLSYLTGPSPALAPGPDQ